MSAHPHIHISSVNMCKCNWTTQVLLNDDINTHLFLVQEPWYDKIGTARRDDAHDGVEVLGGVACPAWEFLYPALTEGQKAKVMTYARKPTQNGHNVLRYSHYLHMLI